MFSPQSDSVQNNKVLSAGVVFQGFCRGGQVKDFIKTFLIHQIRNVRPTRDTFTLHYFLHYRSEFILKSNNLTKNKMEKICSK